MLAVKAKYDNGTVRWPSKPPVSGLHDLIVIFEDVAKGDAAVECLPQTCREAELDQAIEGIQRLYCDIPPSVSLADELIAERRREALNEYGGNLKDEYDIQLIRNRTAER